MKPDADKLRAIAQEADRAGALLASALLRAEGFVDALEQLDRENAEQHRVEIIGAVSAAFLRHAPGNGLGRVLLRRFLPR